MTLKLLLCSYFCLSLSLTKRVCIIISLSQLLDVNMIILNFLILIIATMNILKEILSIIFKANVHKLNISAISFLLSFSLHCIYIHILFIFASDNFFLRMFIGPFTYDVQQKWIFNHPFCHLSQNFYAFKVL